MRERVMRIGKPQALTAIASIPEHNQATDMAVIIVNAGVMHHIGTCRNSVRTARSLADKGYLALRFDFSGIGDSIPRSGTQSFTESASAEISEVMDYLQKSKGISRFTLMGLCSGADAIYESALQDDRVTALCQIDPYCYQTPKWKRNYWMSRFLSPAHWIRFIRFRAGLIKAESNSNIDEDNLELPTYIREYPAREEVSAGLNKLFARNTRILAFFTNGQPKIYNYEKQFVDSMPDVDFKDLFTTAYLPNCTHIIAEPDQQALVIDKITGWVHANEHKPATVLAPENTLSEEIVVA